MAASMEFNYESLNFIYFKTISLILQNDQEIRNQILVYPIW